MMFNKLKLLVMETKVNINLFGQPKTYWLNTENDFNPEEEGFTDLANECLKFLLGDPADNPSYEFRDPTIPEFNNIIPLSFYVLRAEDCCLTTIFLEDLEDTRLNEDQYKAYLLNNFRKAIKGWLDLDEGTILQSSAVTIVDNFITIQYVVG